MPCATGASAEFAEAYAKHGDEIPDPLASATRDSATTRLGGIGSTPITPSVSLSRARCCRCGARHVAPLLPAMTGAGEAVMNDGVLKARWAAKDQALLLLANLSDGRSGLSRRPLGRADLGRQATGAACRPGPCTPRSEVADAATNPRATYRLQLTKDFGFDQAAAIVPYLKALGISHLYASPFLKARPGSTHGYDIVDHDRLNPELGGEDGLPAAERRAQGERPRAHSRFRAQSHGRRPRRQSLVAGRARMGTEVALCGELRHRLGCAAAPASSGRAAADPRPPLWRRAASGRDRTQIRRRGRQLRRLVLRRTSCRSIRNAMARFCAPSSMPRRRRTIRRRTS